jgi:hypothetical protein
MKIISYKFLSVEINNGTEENPVMEQVILDKTMSWSEANEEIAKREAYNGEYTIEDDGVVEVKQPSQLDVIEAQVTYTAMMTDTLLV